MSAINKQNDAKWNEMFDVQYGLCKKVDALLREHLEGLPGPVWTMAKLYVIEHLAETARFDGDIPELPWRVDPAPAPNDPARDQREGR